MRKIGAVQSAWCRALLRTLILSLSFSMLGSVAKHAAAEESPVKFQWGVKIPLRDGVKLNATLYRPRGQREPLPCIFGLTPYIASIYHSSGTYFAARGYVFLSVDVRGRGNSEGQAKLFRQEAQDGYDVVEWLAKQPYCNGKVAMSGGSYGGSSQWRAAGQGPPHLATIIPAAAGFDGINQPLVGNTLSTYWVRWLTLISGRALQMEVFSDDAFWTEQFRHHYLSHGAYAELDRAVGNPSAQFQEWVAHPRLDAYWDSFSLTSEQFARIEFPVLSITGQYDGDQLGAINFYREHVKVHPAAGAHNYLVIGPWQHGQTRTPTDTVGGLKLGAASLLDMRDLHRQWYDWTLKSGPRPPFLQKPIAYYVTGSEEWRYADSLEQATSSTQALYLSAGGGRANDAFESGLMQRELSADGAPDQYVYDPLDVSDAESPDDENSVVDQREALVVRGRRLIYNSEPLTEDTEISGFFRFNAWIALDQPDTDFAVKIYQIAPGGGSVLLSGTQLRARYRESLRREKLVPKAEVLEYRFEGFPFVARRLVKGSQLRLVVGPVNSILWQKNYNSGGVVAYETAKDARTVTVRLYHDPRHPSALYVPIGAASKGTGSSSIARAHFQTEPLPDIDLGQRLAADERATDSLNK